MQLYQTLGGLFFGSPPFGSDWHDTAFCARCVWLKHGTLDSPTISVVVKDFRLKDKDKDKDLMSKDKDKDKESSFKDKDKDKDLMSKDEDKDEDLSFKDKDKDKDLSRH